MMCQLTDINFWASLVTIFSIFLALYIFINDKRENKKNEKKTYINQLESLQFELKKNNNVILPFFNRDKKDWIKGKKIGHFRYSTGVTNRLITEGLIQDVTLLRNLDAIADNESQVNRVLDLISLMGETSQIGSQQEREMFERRIIGESLIIINLNDQVEKYLPKVIKDLEIHISEIIKG